MDHNVEYGRVRRPAEQGVRIEFEVDRTASNSIELEHPKKRGSERQNPMNYAE